MPTQVLETTAAQEPLEAVAPEQAVAIPLTIKSGFVVGRGDTLGQIGSSGKYRRRGRSTVISTAFTTGSPNGRVIPGSFVPGDILTNAAGASVGTILSITNDGVVTLTANAAVAVANGQSILASDGSQIAVCIADEGSDGVGDTTIRAFIGGYFDATRISDLDASALSELGGTLRPGNIFRF